MHFKEHILAQEPLSPPPAAPEASLARCRTPIQLDTPPAGTPLSPPYLRWRHTDPRPPSEPQPGYLRPPPAPTVGHHGRASTCRPLSDPVPPARTGLHRRARTMDDPRSSAPDPWRTTPVESQSLQKCTTGGGHCCADCLRFACLACMSYMSACFYAQ